MGVELEDELEDELEAAHAEIARLKSENASLRSSLSIARGNEASIERLRRQIEKLEGLRTH